MRQFTLSAPLRIIAIFGLLFCVYAVSAQVNINGVVRDANENPLVGATILEKGTQVGTISNFDGKFELEVSNENATLVVSFLGYLTEEIDLDGQRSLQIVLKEDVTGLDEIVVIGYGSQRKKDMTGAIATVDEDRLESIPATNLMGALQGSVAGLSISTSSGAPGSGSEVLVRGTKSILASNSPLVIIDGIPGGSIDDVHPNDIQSIQVLKDAAATSIYGSRASGGVIIITTKRGVTGKVRVSYNGYFGFSDVAKKVDVVDVDEYVAKKREIYRMQNSNYRNDEWISYDSSLNISEDNFLPQYELEMFDSGRSYNWLDEITRRAPIHSHNLSLSGGDKKTTYYMSANITDQTGIVYNSDMNKYSVRGNISSKFTNWLKVGTNLLVNRTEVNSIEDEIFAYTYQLSPLARKYENEFLKDEYTLTPMYPDEYIANPFTELEIKDIKIYTKILNSTYLEFTPLKGLTYKVSLNTVMDHRRHNHFVPLRTRQVKAFDKAENASIDYRDRLNINFENLLNYYKVFDKHSINATFVFATEEYQEDYLWAYAWNFGTDYYEWTALEFGQVDFRDMDSNEQRTFLESYVGRLNYNYASKYLLQLSLRNDRSSKFSEENRNAVFPGISVGWVASEETFMKNLSALNNLKFRLSWAKTGNQAIGYRDRFNVGDVVYYTTGQDGKGSVVEGLVQTSLANKDLRWEISTEINTGIDFQLFEGRLSGVFEYYKTLTEGLLWNQSISPITGYTYIRNNVGNIQNKGIELKLDGLIIQKSDFTFNTTATFSKNNNEILDLDGTKTDDVESRLFIGQPVGVVYDYEFDGILQEGEEAPYYMPNLIPGEAKVKNVGSFITLEDGTTVRTTEPDSTINEADMKVIGQIHPTWYGSLGFNFTYKKVNLSVFINHVHGITRSIPVDVNARSHSMDIPYYTDENPSTQYGRPGWPRNLGRVGNQYGYTSYFVDGSYTRLQDVTLTYDLTNKVFDNLGVSNFKVYLTGQNLFTLTEYMGYDPAIDYSSHQTKGEVDKIDGYPTIKNIILGVNLTF